MTAKQDILAKLRKSMPQSTSLPELNEAWISYPDREAQFAQTLAFVGGEAVFLDDRGQLPGAIEKLACLLSAKQIVCTVPDVPLGNIDLNAVVDPHDLAGIDVAILPGQFAVAENGAVWVTGDALKHRSIYTITQYLVLVVRRTELIDHMHAAYQRLSFAQPGYGLFISGPSKTADIEQSLVIGAHGARALTVVMVPSE